MVSLMFNTRDGPTLLIDDEVVHGINILERLHAMLRDPDVTEDTIELFNQAASMYQRTRVPRIGFSLEDPAAIMPDKKIIDIGYDLTAVAVAKQLTQATTMYETFVKVHVPLGYYVEMVPRSSLSKTGYMLANNVGIIDPGYTGTLKIALIKVDQSMPNLELPARICQLIVKPYVVSEHYDARHDKVLLTGRGDGGFGSTG